MPEIVALLWRHAGRFADDFAPDEPGDLWSVDHQWSEHDVGNIALDGTRRELSDGPTRVSQPTDLAANHVDLVHPGLSFFVFSLIDVQERQAYPIQVIQTVRQEGEKPQKDKAKPAKGKRACSSFPNCAGMSLCMNLSRESIVSADRIPSMVIKAMYAG